jgi:nitroreductase
MDLIEAIAARRSKGKMMRDETPSRALIEKVLGAAVHAPNHHDTQPWRFYVLSGEARDEFGNALADALKARESGMDATKLEGLMIAERAKPMRSPVLVVVGVQSQRDDEMERREDLQAASAAVQCMLLAADSVGLAAIWRTGEGAYDDRIKAYFGLRPEDQIAGIVYLGYADTSLPPLAERERVYADRTEWRGPIANN